MKLVVVLGSPTPPGKLARALGAATAAAAGRAGWQTDLLAPLANPSGLSTEWPEDAEARISGADAVLIGTPVFRGSLPGLLKTLLDSLPGSALRDTPAGVVSVSAAPQHAFAADRHLREILGWFGAIVTPTSAAIREQDLVGEVTAAARDELDAIVTTLQTIAERLDGCSFGPDPLAQRAR